jgi:hypothetical protein
MINGVRVRDSGVELFECLPEQREVVLRKPGALFGIIGEAGRNEPVGAIQAIGNNVIAAHSAVVRAAL